MTEFEGLVAVVTGAASGIGLATVAAFSGRGAHVVAIDRQPLSDPHASLSLVADITEQKSVNNAIQVAVSDLGRIDIVVNNAGIGSVGTVEDNPEEEWRAVFDVNVLGIIRVMRACLPQLRQSQHGVVVNVSSIAATAGLTQRACYSASKGAVLSLTLATAADLLPDGIRVNCVTPGTIDTPWVARLLAETADPETHRMMLEQRQPMGRLGLAEEVASAITFLASPDSGFITGIVLPVDGGMSGLRRPHLNASRNLGSVLDT